MLKQHRCIPQEVLKLIALVTMFIDHFGAVVVPLLPIADMPNLYYACRIVGRLSFPLYAFLLAQGVRHTSRPMGYLLRLAIGAVLSELPYDLAMEGCFTWEHQSVMLTLLLGAGLLTAQKKVDSPWLKALMILPFALVTDLCGTYYGAVGVVMMAIFSMTENFWAQLLGVTLCNLLLPGVDVTVLGIVVPIQIFAIPAMLFIGLYSGRKLTRNRAVQWCFYLFYPAHLVFLWILQGMLR